MYRNRRKYFLLRFQNAKVIPKGSLRNFAGIRSARGELAISLLIAEKNSTLGGEAHNGSLLTPRKERMLRI